jgi:hypothetical protein
LFGVSLDVSDEDIDRELSKRQIHKPVKIEKIRKSKCFLSISVDTFNDECAYIKLTFDVPLSVDRMLEQDISINGKNVLVIPNVDNISVDKLVPFHQVLVTFSKNTPAKNLLTQSNSKEEIEYLYSFFKEFGKIVDMNLEYMPTCLVVTYTRHESVLSLISKSKLSVTI